MIYYILFKFLDNFKITSDSQFGTCYKTLVLVSKRFFDNLEKVKPINGMFLDFSKAFDVVDYSILFHKLAKNGILEVFSSDRAQVVKRKNLKNTPER